mmetsp:Transcript_27982/g.39549  ORF Transcript_27982/g.39549 Transcript_27982/m.39549 type:complete len:141 (-) Transcript_27982:287-709(-)
MSSNNPGAAMAAAVDVEVAKYRSYQEEIAKLQQTVQALMMQENENEMVKRELELLDDSSQVYKRVGPVLMKNDLSDAKDTVEKRLEFIRGEKEKSEQSLKDKQTKSNECARKVSELQGLMQKAAVEAAKAAAADAQKPKV